MDKKSIILVGGPDSGKSNYLGRLWLALQSKKFNLISITPPDDLVYIEGIAAHILQGKFVPRTEPEDKKRNFEVLVKSKNNDETAEIIVPDILGEIWKKAVTTLEIPEKWLKALRDSTGAIIFVRVLSDNNVQPLDWVTSQKLLKAGLQNNTNSEIPTQVVLLELLRFIQDNVSSKSQNPYKIAVIVTAWDFLHIDEANEGPEMYLLNQFPIFAGKLGDLEKLKIKVFGSSIVGGDLKVDDFVKAFLNGNIDDSGYIVSTGTNNETVKTEDITEPINWLLG